MIFLIVECFIYVCNRARTGRDAEQKDVMDRTSDLPVVYSDRCRFVPVVDLLAGDEANKTLTDNWFLKK